MKRMLSCALAFMAWASTIFSPALAQDYESWPQRPINIVVGFGAGGTTDLVARGLAAEMEKLLGVRITVNNMPGADGATAYQHVLSSPRDGYTIAAFSSSIGTMAVLGSHPSSVYSHWQPWVAATFDGVVSVGKNSPFENFEQLLEKAKANPNTITLAASNAGSVWHVQSELLRSYAGVHFKFVAYPGSHPSQVAAMAGDVDVVWTAIGEQRDLIRSGQLRPLTVFRSTSANIEGAGEIPPVTQFLPDLEKRLPLSSYIGIMVAQDTPEKIKEKIERAFVAATQTEAFRNLVEGTLAGTVLGYAGKESLAYVRKQTSSSSWLLHELGLTQHSPEKFGIPRP